MSNKLLLAVNFVGNDKLSGSIKNIIGLGKSGGRALKDMKGEARKLDRELAGVRRELSGASGNITELVNRGERIFKASGVVDPDWSKCAIEVYALLDRLETVRGVGATS